jgi:GST-like protein
MIDLYYWTTPNGHKITIFPEEARVPYRIVPVNIGAGEQFSSSFLSIAPNNRIPAIVDTQPVDGGAPGRQFTADATSAGPPFRLAFQVLREHRRRFLEVAARARALQFHDATKLAQVAAGRSQQKMRVVLGAHVENSVVASLSTESWRRVSG